MRMRLLLAAVCIIAFPLMFSPSRGDKLTSSVPFATVAYAGRTMLGGWCQCGCYACICDPDEEAMMCLQSSRAVSDNPGPVNQGSGSSGAGSAFGFDFGSGTLMFALAFFAWARFRASGF